MNSDLVEFYYLTKHASSISSREKEASVKEQDEKIAADLRQIASSFAKNHPKAVENAITGGILGGGSELVLPANKDMMGNPSTNLGEIGKRALLGATLGGIGGEVKTRVRNHVLPKIAQENTEKIAGKLDKLKTAGFLQSAGTFAKYNPLTIGGTVAGAGLGGYTGYKHPDLMVDGLRKDNNISGAISGGLAGGVLGGTLGQLGDSGLALAQGKNIYSPEIDRLTQMTESLNKGTEKLKNNTARMGINEELKNSPVLSKDIRMPTTKKIPHKNLNEQKLLPAVAESSKPTKSSILDKVKSTFSDKPKNIKTAGIFDIAKKLAPTAGIRGAVTAGQQLAPSSLLQTAGKYMAKSPTVGGAAIGAGAGLTGNFLSGEDHAVGSALAGAGLGALGGKKLLVGNASKSPLFGQSFGTGVRNELKAGLKAKPVISSPITSPSLQNAPKLDSLLAQSGASNIGPSIKPNKPVGPAIAPQRPQEIDWAKKQAPVR